MSLQAQCPHMVRLLHHFETANHRLYLLLEHVGGGRMVDLVAARREQWERLRKAAMNPSSSSSLLHHNQQPPATTSSPSDREKEESLNGELSVFSSPSLPFPSPLNCSLCTCGVLYMLLSSVSVKSIHVN